MRQLTERAYKEKTLKLQSVVKSLEKAKAEMRRTVTAGDLRENAEYDAARDSMITLSKMKADLEAELEEAEVVAEDNSPRITIGSLVEVCKVDRENKEIGKPRRFRIEERGDTVIAGVLGINSSLGKAVLNGTSNYYDIPDNGGLRYRVTKIIAGSSGTL